MMSYFLAQADTGNAILGFLMIIGIIWFVAALCTPKQKGWDINHRGQTSIKPRK
ncbi:MAG: hypothetical protein AAGA30_00150 [Planctomycetota bacterium]